MNSSSRSRDVITVVLALGTAGVLGRVTWDPIASHTLVTCVAMLVGAVLVARGPAPRWFPRGWVRAAALPCGVGLASTAVAAWLLLGPLSGAGRPTAPLDANVVLLVIMVPVAEEGLFRGALLRLAPQRPIAAALASSAVFALLHAQLGWGQVALMGAVGCGLCAVALRTRGLALPIVLHGVFNALAAGYQGNQPTALLLAVGLTVAVAAAGWLAAREER